MDRLRYKRHAPEEAHRSHQKITSIWQRVHMDPLLFVLLNMMLIFGLFLLYSAGNQSYVLIQKQLLHIGLAFLVLFSFSQIPPRIYKQWAPWLFGIGLLLLIIVLGMGVIGKGAQRWLNLGLFRFEPSEIMKLAMPMMLAWYLNAHPLPPRIKYVFICIGLIIIPALLTAKQPDLGTAMMLLLTGFFVLVLAGISLRFIIISGLLGAVCMPLFWHFMHDYQKQRVLIFLNPERDPLGSGYHIIQSKIAIGSGGFLGKGWLLGTQAHLQFLPEHTTDFIFALCGEEFGFLGCFLLLLLALCIVCRCLYISIQAQDTFGRLLAGGLSLSFFSGVFVNIGMVTGILPVVGLPLPLISYGGTTLVTVMAGFGVIMSIHTHRKLLNS